MHHQYEITDITNVSEGFFILRNIRFNKQTKEGKVEEQLREVYNTANGVTVLLYNVEQQSVVLTRQFRIATTFNGNTSGLMIEACAGIIEGEDPATSIKREIEEETGYKIDKVEKVYELFSSPGATTEKLFYFVAAYQPNQRKSEGGGLEDEQEEIDVLEMPFEKAWHMLQQGEINDAKTTILLQHARINIFQNKQ